MFILKSGLDQYIQKQAERLYKKELQEIEKEHRQERKQLVKEYQKKISTALSEKNQAIADAEKFYEMYRDVPSRLYFVCRKMRYFPDVVIATTLI